MAGIYELIEQAETEYQDRKAKKNGFIVAIAGQLYTRTLGKHSAVYIERISNKWEVWRETHQSGGREPTRFYMIFSAKEFEYALLQAVSYFDYIILKREGKYSVETKQRTC